MGNEFRVNGYQNNWQREAHITTFRDGSFLVVYESYINDYDDGPSATSVLAQRYDASGRAVGGEQFISGQDGCCSSNARVTTLSDGGYVVVYTFDSYDDILTLDLKVYAKVYNADGSARSGAIRVDNFNRDLADAVAPAAIATASGGFCVVLGGERAAPGANGIEQVYSRAFDRDGNPLQTRPTLVNVNEGQFDQLYVRTAQLEGGRSIAIWNSEGSFEIGTDLDSNEVRGTIFGRNGDPIRRDFHLTDNIGTVGNGGDGAGYDVAALNNGGFMVSQLEYGYRFNSDALNVVLFRLFNENGRATSREIIVYRSEEVVFQSRAAQLDTGEIVVIWEQYSETRGDSGRDILGRMYSANGQTLTGVFEVGQDQFKGDSQEDPEIAALAGGGFVVTYTSDSIDADKEGVAARVFGRGTAADDRLSVDRTGMMAGLGGDDRITGNGGRNALFGNRGDDTLSGGSGADTLWGGAGRDLLAGNAGADRFVFSNAPGAANLDTIAGFNDSDRIWLENAAFRGIGDRGELSARVFKVLGQGVDGNDRILYDRGSGILYYDANGSGPGQRVAFADIGGEPRLTHDDFTVI